MYDIDGSRKLIFGVPVGDRNVWELLSDDETEMLAVQRTPIPPFTGPPLDRDNDLNSSPLLPPRDVSIEMIPGGDVMFEIISDDEGSGQPHNDADPEIIPDDENSGQSANHADPTMISDDKLPDGSHDDANLEMIPDNARADTISHDEISDDEHELSEHARPDIVRHPSPKIIYYKARGDIDPNYRISDAGPSNVRQEASDDESLDQISEYASPERVRTPNPIFLSPPPRHERAHDNADSDGAATSDYIGSDGSLLADQPPRGEPPAGFLSRAPRADFPCGLSWRLDPSAPSSAPIQLRERRGWPALPRLRTDLRGVPLRRIPVDDYWMRRPQPARDEPAERVAQ